VKRGTGRELRVWAKLAALYKLLCFPQVL